MDEAPSQDGKQSELSPLPKTSSRYRWISALFAFLIWGGWAYYVNGEAAENQRLTSSLVQGTASLIITLLMVHAVTWLQGHIAIPYVRPVLPAVLTVSFTGSCLCTIHYVIGTPNILYTVTPALSVAFLFCLYTTYKLQKHSHDDTGSIRE